MKACYVGPLLYLIVVLLPIHAGRLALAHGDGRGSHRKASPVVRAVRLPAHVPHLHEDQTTLGMHPAEDRNTV
jgi:hypothetical protein